MGVLPLGRGDGRDGEHVVHGAGTVALRVERDVGEAAGAERRGDLVEHGDGERAGKVLAGDLDAGEFAVVADADLGKAEGVHRVFGAFYLTQIFGGYSAAVLDARGEAGAGGLVGEGEAR